MIDLSYNDGYSHVKMHIIDPDSTEVAAVAKEGRKVIEAHAALSEAKRERAAAERTLEGVAADARRAAIQAGKDEKPVKKGDLRKARAAAQDAFEDADLDWTAAVSKMDKRRRAYFDVIEHHTPALRAEAQSALDAQILSLAGVSTSAQRIQSAMTASLALLGALSTVGDFTPGRPLKARKAEFGEAGYPPVFIGVGRESLGKAIDYASRIMDDLKTAEKVAKLEKEADEAPELDDDDDDDDAVDYS